MRNLRTILMVLVLLGFITAKADAQGTVKGIVI